MEEVKKSTSMTPPILFASLNELRDRLLIARIEAGVTIVEEVVKELHRQQKLEAQVNRLTAELEEYRSLAEKLGAEKAVSERDRLDEENKKLKQELEELQKRLK